MVLYINRRGFYTHNTAYRLTTYSLSAEAHYYFYFHIFPGIRAQHCTYATLLAGSAVLFYEILSKPLWALIVVYGRLTFLPVALVVTSAAKHPQLLHSSTPLTVHRIWMHSDLNGGLIAVGFRLSMTRIGCSSNQTWISREYVCVIWWSSSIKFMSKVIGIGLSSTSVSVIAISKLPGGNLDALGVLCRIGAAFFDNDIL